MLRLAAAVLFIISPAYGQTVDDLIAEGDSLWEALQPAAAIGPYAAAIRRDQQRAEAWWKYARSQVDIAKQLVSDDDREARDSIYGIAHAYAQSALNIDVDDADAHFVLALVLGEQSRTRGGRERVQFAEKIYDEATKALALSPEHDGAMHILGAWHAEVRRLSGLTRFFAKALFGGGFLGRANWDSATTYLERAVAIKPSYIFHRLELARIYVDVDRHEDALGQLEAIVPLAPTGDVLDPRHKAEAAELEAELRSR